ncbi:carbohydrate ABC transporter permease [Cohnella sp. 56]|uniref:carbohydrate ABC transporter permease n=1 Tax=Cohnella sp. 56 TaxID=3113722 RepID=UPI0030E91833
MVKQARKRRRSNWADLSIEIVLAAFGALMLFPFLYLIVNSFKEENRIFDIYNIPDFTHIANFRTAIASGNYLQSLFNSVVITAGALALIILLSSMAGFTIGRAGKGFFQVILYILLTGMIIPLQVSMVPLYKMGVTLHLMNTRTFLILLYAAGSIPLATFLYVGFTKAISREYDEAAKLDGCNRFDLYWRVVFPLLLPATGTVIVTSAFGIWNDFSSPLLFLYDERKQTVVSMIYHFKGEKTMDWAPVFALCTLATLPMIVLFLFVQKRFFQQLASGGLKG